MSDFDQTYGSSVNARMAAQAGAPLPEPVDDIDRDPMPGDPPVEGAQWDEVHRRWERWDERAHAWVVVGDDPGDGVDPLHENPLPPVMARELLTADDLEGDHEPVSDVDRAPEPPAGPPGAQWNEVEQRWERWDEASETWVEAT